MKTFFSLYFYLLSCILATGMDGYKRNPAADIIHYDFSISVSDTNNIIFGHSVITVKFSESVNTIGFDLKNTGSNKKGMNVQNVTFDK